MPISVREFTDNDAASLRECVVVMQEFERTIDERLLPGETIADEYCEHLRSRCRNSDGRIFVAELDVPSRESPRVIGFVCVLAAEPFTELDDPPGTYALISDLAVLDDFRRRGTGRALLQRAEAFARSEGASELRIGVLARNEVARSLYLSEGFATHLEIMSKRW